MAAILVADDELDVRLLVRMVIEMAGDGWEIVAEVADGVEAVKRWRRLSGPARPDVVILDNRMPRASGLEAARQICSEDPRQLVVLCSAFLDEQLRAEAAEAGIAACLTKGEIPTLPRLLRELLATARLTPGGPGTAPA